ncbi:metallophosphoesterase family protein [Saccharomonospora cyanea]|uniref:Putative phosphoesterase, ICC n=1 Tax=Saccharomonospora cyanea NA-134 TaxID=882082 RepID=H5XLQ9_9PSEU|nr:metallophosphoesterase [Saccharomonospora cyanea]EHR60957.1 putative phosphoesterase, ICC [Saccharomonospora cyanea NA-134]
MIRIAAVGDVHLGENAQGRLRPALENLRERADVLLLAGDLTRHGTPAEARIVAREFADLGLPVLAVLGNHDYHADAVDEVTAILDGEAGIRVLEGDGVVLPVDGTRLGVAGVKGFAGGFEGRCASAFGEPEMKVFVEHTVDIADSLRSALKELDADVRVALMHYSPVPDTLHGEPLEIYPFLGAYQLGEVVDEVGAALAVHGHAHSGCEHGVTPAGVRVRNVAQPVIRSAYALYCLEDHAPPAAGEHA